MRSSMGFASARVLVATAAALVACSPAVSADQPPQPAQSAPASARGAVPQPAVASSAATSAPVEQPAPAASASAPTPVPSSASEKLVQDAVELDFGRFPRKLTEQEREFLGMIWLLADRQDALTLLTRSPTKQNADGWLALLGDHLVALGVDGSKLTRLACVDPNAKRVFSQVRKSPASCGDVVDDWKGLPAAR
jgi:hypothetical protein